jgi:phosphatidylglycerophosphatase A
MKRDVRREARVLLRHPAGWVASGLGSGLSPWASGTTGSAAAVVLFWLLGATDWPCWAHLAIVGLLFGAGVWAADWACRQLGIDDASPIVIDEWAGQWLTLAVGAASWPLGQSRPLDISYLLAGFLLFRLADIVKPWPASALDRQLGGGLGAMADDMVAALYSAAALAGMGLILS